MEMKDDSKQLYYACTPTSYGSQSAFQFLPIKQERAI